MPKNLLELVVKLIKTTTYHLFEQTNPRIQIIHTRKLDTFCN